VSAQAPTGREQVVALGAAVAFLAAASIVVWIVALVVLLYVHGPQMPLWWVWWGSKSVEALMVGSLVGIVAAAPWITGDEEAP
jgi:hypothetical protein